MERSSRNLFKAYENSIILASSKNGKFTDVFNEKFRKAYEFDKEYVRFIAENYEIIGESISFGHAPIQEYQLKNGQFQRINQYGVLDILLNRSNARAIAT